MHGRSLCSALLALCSLQARALQVEVLQLSHDESVFHVVVEVLIEAPTARVREVLLDPARISQLDPAILATRAQPQGSGTRVEMDVRECLLGLCRTLLQVQQVEAAGNEITARTLPVAGSGFRSGIAHWQLGAEGASTRLLFTADTEPDVWLPPFIGPRAVMKQLHQRTLASLEALERLARVPQP